MGKLTLPALPRPNGRNDHDLEVLGEAAQFLTDLDEVIDQEELLEEVALLSAGEGDDLLDRLGSGKFYVSPRRPFPAQTPQGGRIPPKGGYWT